MRNSAPKRVSWAGFFPVSGVQPVPDRPGRSDERLAGLRDKRFGNAEPCHMAGPMTRKHAVRTLCLHKLDLDD